MTGSQAAKLLWSPSSTSTTQIDQFRRHIAKSYSVPLPDYGALHKWSCDNIAEFWKEVWEWTDVVASEPWTEIIDLSIPMASIPPWFVGAKLNWAENMLRCRSTTKTALIETSEPPPNSPLQYSRISYADLYTRVHHTALALRSLGLTPSSIVGFYGPTCTASVVLLLATTSLGAIWSSAAADFGPAGVLERFEQFGDKLWGVVGVESVRYNGKVLVQRGKLETVVQGLEKGRTGEALKVVVVDYLQEEGVRDPLPRGWMKWEELGQRGEALAAKDSSGEHAKIDFYQAAFDHPLWVLFSSGTTGKPKPIVHRAGGMLLQSKKEHVLHGNMGPDDVFIYYTTPGWMMYNYLVSGLSTSCTLVLFDGSPLFRPELLWDLAQDLGVTVFGTSAKYLDVLSKSYSPKAHHALPALKQILSTGSPLKPELFPWIYEHIKADVLLGSITGGTDICSLFGSHNAALPVYAGEIQCLGLGMSVESWSEDGARVSASEQGDLVCTKPFPCMPVFFWGDADGSRYRASYFEKFEGVWAHGDFCIVTPSQSGNGGGLLMLGRSDGVLNPSGIRFGSSEIYEVLDTFAPSATSSAALDPFGVIEDSLVVGQKTQGGSDERVVLFVKMVAGKSLDEALLKEIKLRIRTTRSARHVPERILQVNDIPHTVNGKKVEVPIKKLLGGAPLASVNASTLRNPECLDEYVQLGRKLRAEVE